MTADSAQVAIPRNQIDRGGNAILTPELFLALDRMARVRVGRSIQVKSHEKMRGEHDGRQDWGRAREYVLHCLDVRLLRGDSNARVWEESSGIALVPSIPLARLYEVRRPELDWTAVPSERMFEFVALHEIGHYAQNYESWWAFERTLKAKGMERSEIDAIPLRMVNEVLADRYAWSQLFPGSELPTHAERTVPEDRVAYWLDRVAALTPMMKIAEPMNADPLTFVPENHFKGRIPWAAGVTRTIDGPSLEYLTGLRRARVDHRNYQRRWWRTEAKRRAAGWLEIARTPTEKAFKEASQFHRFPSDRARWIAEARAERAQESAEAAP